MNQKVIKITLWTIVLCLLSTIYIHAGVTGKISGVVLDDKTGEPVIGATIKVIGTNLGTLTDTDGEYFMINVPGGKYDISVSSIGFETIIKKDVRVLVDLTTPVDFDLIVKTVQIDKNVVVYAENPTIQKDLTASKIIFTADQIQSLPNINSVQSILTNYPGVVIGKDNDLHVRGGRDGEVSYYFDGFSVQDPFVNNSGLRIIPNSLEELTLTSGGYTSEYGEALSGIVSAITREGGSTYKGSVRMYEGMTHPYSIYDGDWLGMERIGNRSASFNLSGPIPGMKKGSDNFSFAGEYLHNPTYLPHNGFVSYTGTSKFSLQPVQKLRLISNLTYYESKGEVYKHRDVNGRSYDFNLDGLPYFKKQSYLVGLSGNYHFNDNFVWSTRFNHFYTYTKSAPEHLFDTYWAYWPGYSEDENGIYNGTVHLHNYGNDPDYTDEAQVVGFTTGDDYDPTYRMRESRYNAIHSSLVNQLSKIHQLKAGFEYRVYEINWDFKQFYNNQPYGEVYDSKPKYFSIFAQDKMEYDHFIVNLGLRYDYRKDDVTYLSNPTDEVPVYKEASSVSNISPRLGVSFPISDQSVMHFNYGVYYQFPKFTYLYTNLQGELNSGYPLLGNPNLKPERTVSYELGFDHMVTERLQLDVTAYQKNITDLVSTRSYYKHLGNAVTTFVNEDYGTSRGLDLQLKLIKGNSYLSGSISYGYMIAEGVASDALEPYYSYITSTSDTLAPVTEFALDFDQRHTVTAVLDYRVPSNWNQSIAGLSIPGDWGISMVGYYGSGLPYTVTDYQGNRLGERNEGRLPSNYNVDAKFNKLFRLSGGRYLMNFFVEVDNLFNKRNILDVYTNTGRADNDGTVTGAGLSLDENTINEFDVLYDLDPQNYSPPRTIRTGLEFQF